MKKRILVLALLLASCMQSQAVLVLAVCDQRRQAAGSTAGAVVRISWPW